MPMDAQQIKEYVTEAFPDAVFEVIDLADDNDHWALNIQSKSFCGKSRVQQHKMVYSALKGKMGTDIHALQLKTKAL